MKNYLFFITIAFIFISKTVNAKEWTFIMGNHRRVSFEIPNDYEIDTISSECFAFKKDDVELTVETITIDNFNKKKAITIPDSILVPNVVIIDREVPCKGSVLRIITSKDHNGSLFRHYVFFNRSGIIILSANASNLEETDQIAKSYDSHFKWGKLLLLIFMALFGIVPSILIAMALEYHKESRHKFWQYCIIAFLMIVILSIVLSMLWEIKLWILLFCYLLGSIALGICFNRGIIVF